MTVAASCCPSHESGHGLLATSLSGALLVCRY